MLNCWCPARASFYSAAIALFVSRAWVFCFVTKNLFSFILIFSANNYTWILDVSTSTAYMFVFAWLFSSWAICLKINKWNVYVLQKRFLFAVLLCVRADFMFLTLSPDILQLIDSVWSNLFGFLISYRESFKDIHFEKISDPESITRAIQIVGSLSFEVRVLLQSLGQAVYHNGKFPKNKKMVGFEFGLLSVAFPHVCEGITADNLIGCRNTYGNQAGMIGALGIVYVVYGQFCLSVIEVLVVGNSGAKTAPQPASCYKRVGALFNRRNRAVKTKSNFKLTGAGQLDYLTQCDRRKDGKALRSRSRRASKEVTS